MLRRSAVAKLSGLSVAPTVDFVGLGGDAVVPVTCMDARGFDAAGKVHRCRVVSIVFAVPVGHLTVLVVTPALHNAVVELHAGMLAPHFN